MELLELTPERLIVYAIAFVGIFFLFANKSKKEFHIERNSRLTEKVCPYCKSKNKINNVTCDSCNKSIEFSYGERVCLHCGHTGRMKKYSVRQDINKHVGFAWIPLFWFGGKNTRHVCKKCNRLIRESDYRLCD